MLVEGPKMFWVGERNLISFLSAENQRFMIIARHAAVDM